MDFFEELLKEDARQPTQENEIDIEKLSSAIAMKIENKVKSDLETIKSEIKTLKEKGEQNNDNNTENEQRTDEKGTVSFDKESEDNVD